MKILAIYDGGGTRYHRVKLPLSFFKDHQVFFSKDLNEDLIKEIDVLWIGWNHNVYPHYLSAWQAKYGFKIIVDIDDSWEIPKNHVSNMTRSVELSKKYVSLADEVIVSNWRLIEPVSKLNPNVHLIENGIPYGWGQFQVKEESEEEFMNRRVKIGFFGGGKHYNDWVAIQGWIRTLVNNQLFKENADFYICGYNPKDPVWRKVASKFPEAKLIEGKPVENYIPVFDLDMCLVPLEDNYFNTCKTELRVLESVCPGALCLLDPIYRELGENYQYHVICEKDKDFLTATLDLLRNKEQLWMLKRDAQTLTRHHEEVLRGGYIEKCVKPRLKLIEQKEVFSDFQIWSIMYNEDQLYDFYPYVNPIKTVEELSYLFEYNPMTKLIPKSKGKYVGIFSHKFGMKTGINRNRVIRILEQEESDVVGFCKQIPNYLQWTEKQHPGFLWRFTKLCRELGLSCKEPRNVVYSNFFVAKPEVYQEYVKLLQKAIVYLSDKSYKAFEPIKYVAGLSKEDLEKATGLKHYTWHTFLLERLMSIWIDNKKLTFKNYID